MERISAIFGVVLSAHCAVAENLKVRLAEPAAIERRLEAGLVAANKREDAIAKLLQDAGCEVSRQRVR